MPALKCKHLSLSVRYFSYVWCYSLCPLNPFCHSQLRRTSTSEVWFILNYFIFYLQIVPLPENKCLQSWFWWWLWIILPKSDKRAIFIFININIPFKSKHFFFYCYKYLPLKSCLLTCSVWNSLSSCLIGTWNKTPVLNQKFVRQVMLFSIHRFIIVQPSIKILQNTTSVVFGLRQNLFDLIWIGIIENNLQHFYV